METPIESSACGDLLCARYLSYWMFSMKCVRICSGYLWEREEAWSDLMAVLRKVVYLFGSHWSSRLRNAEVTDLDDLVVLLA